MRLGLGTFERHEAYLNPMSECGRYPAQHGDGEPIVVVVFELADDAGIASGEPGELLLCETRLLPKLEDRTGEGGAIPGFLEHELAFGVLANVTLAEVIGGHPPMLRIQAIFLAVAALQSGPSAVHSSASKLCASAT